MEVTVNGVRLFYEVQGQGQPLILVHGNGERHEIFDAAIPELQKKYRVYAVDSRCHGRSEDTPDISYNLMAQDLLAFMDALDIQSPIFYGFSDGGIIGLLIAMQAPNRLSRLIISGANCQVKGLTAWTIFEMRVHYFFTRSKLDRMMLTEPNIPLEDLERITVPTHILAGSHDVIRESHTRALAAHIPNSTLEILPGEGHDSYIIHSKKLYPILKKYLSMGE